MKKKGAFDLARMTNAKVPLALQISKPRDWVLDNCHFYLMLLIFAGVACCT